MNDNKNLENVPLRRKTHLKRHGLSGCLMHDVSQNGNPFQGCIMFGNCAREELNQSGVEHLTDWDSGIK